MNDFVVCKVAGKYTSSNWIDRKYARENLKGSLECGDCCACDDTGKHDREGKLRDTLMRKER
ncbi:MAG: hypothetical protein KKE20_05540 [Nanoarchaeota archaeon]|nr:hypothetical protein [Nanoarchaeota archaeon]